MNEHKRNNDLIFALIKVLYSNFKKGRIYQNFNIINNYDNNTNFDEEQYTPFTETTNLNAYKNNILFLRESFSFKKDLQFLFQNETRKNF